jgi:pseudaminic acid synthase
LTPVLAIKFSTELPETVTIDCNKKDFVISGGTLWDNHTLWDLYHETSMPYEWHQPLMELVQKLGLISFSTPCTQHQDPQKDPITLLESLNVPCYKIASFEITDIPFIRRIAKLGKPIIMSTGVAEYEDIKLAMDTCKEEGNNQIVLLKCTSAYPTPLEDVNLKAMIKMKEDFNCLVGISDHSMYNEVSIASVALGGCVIEKHAILDRKLGGPDAPFSLEPKEWKDLVDSVRKTEKLLGKATYELTEKAKTGKNFTRSLYAVQNIKAGDVITSDNVQSIRPGYGLHPKYLDIKNPNCILGKKTIVDIEFGERIELDKILL